VYQSVWSLHRRPGRAGAGRLFYSTFDVTYVFPTLRSHKSARAAVQVTTYGRKPRSGSGHSHRGPALSIHAYKWALLLV